MKKAMASMLCGLVCFFAEGAIAVKEHDKKTIYVGMDLEEALVILKTANAKPELLDIGDVQFSEPGDWKQYVVKPLYESKDALFLFANKREGSDEYKIRMITWHINYDEDSALPKAYRALRELNLQSVDASVLLPNQNAKRRFPKPLDNPFE